MKYLALAIATGSLLISSGSFAASDWQPVSAESLVKLPANLIEKRISQDFRMSPEAQQLLDIENQIANQSKKIQALQTLVKDADQAEFIDEKVDLVQLKSGFLDLLQDGQSIRQKQLESKIQVYQEVLEKLYLQSNEDSTSEAFKLKVNREEAKARMQKVMQQVDDNLLQQGFSEQSPYAQEFASNLGKIEKLKQAIAKHESNMAAKFDGKEVSTQEYLRQLLMQASSEQSLLDQEDLMLSYMAKIVALDAQSLEFAIAETQEKEALSSAGISTTPANSVTLFL